MKNYMVWWNKHGLKGEKVYDNGDFIQLNKGSIIIGITSDLCSLLI